MVRTRDGPYNLINIWDTSILLTDILVLSVSNISITSGINIIFYKKCNIRVAIVLRYIYCKRQQVY